MDGIPQGINYGVGITNLAFQKREHEKNISDPNWKKKYRRARLLDDAAV